VGVVCASVALSATLMCATSGGLRPFTTDGCTLVPERWFAKGERWRACCVKHDHAYWAGGTRSERRAADDRLKACLQAAESPRFASLARTVVGLFGGPYWPTWYRWAYGWPYSRGYRELSPEELRQVEGESEAP